jgi:hypothetical protein
MQFSPARPFLGRAPCSIFLSPTDASYKLLLIVNTEGGSARCPILLYRACHFSSQLGGLVFVVTLALSICHDGATNQASSIIRQRCRIHVLIRERLYDR